MQKVVPIKPYSASDIQNKPIVMEILEAAKNGSIIFWDDFVKTVE